MSCISGSASTPRWRRWRGRRTASPATVTSTGRGAISSATCSPTAASTPCARPAPSTRWSRWRPGTDSRLAALDLVDHGVATAPGTAFGEVASDQLRLSLAASESALRAGIERLVAWSAATAPARPGRAMTRMAFPGDAGRSWPLTRWRSLARIGDMVHADRRTSGPARARSTRASGSNEVLKGVDLVVSPGEHVVVFGPSGSGKSTLLRTINLLERPTSGSVWCTAPSTAPGSPASGRASGADGDRAAPPVGMVFQQFNLFPHLSALDNVAIALRRAKHDRQARRARARRRRAAPGRPARPRRPSTPTSCPAASSSASRSPGRWRWTPR